MSSRIPPNAGDSRFPRERSPTRYDRRPPNDGRPIDTVHERNDSYGGRGAVPREPPRGPKAQLGSRGFQGRGRGLGGRGDGRERERDFRDEPFGRGRGRGQDWDSRDRYEARDRRTPPPTRTRSRSPYREPRDAEPSLKRRNSRDAPLSSTDTFPPRGRGVYRGRGRGDWEYTRGKSYHPEDRAYDQGSHPRDRPWDLQARDYASDPTRRDEDSRSERERGREDRTRSEQAPYRPDSRNSYGASRSTSTASLQQNIQDHIFQPTRTALDASLSLEKGHILADNRSDKEGPARDLDQSDTSYRRLGNERPTPRASSPPPVPSVPAFGSVIPQTMSSPEFHAKPGIPHEEEPQIHPSRRALLEPSKVPATPSSNVLNAPTAPKAQQRLSNEESVRAISNKSPAAIRPRDVPREPVPNWSKRFPHSNAPTAPRASSAEQPSVRKALDEEGRNGNVPSISNLKAPSSDPNLQTSPMRIPTGPRAGRQAPPSIRQPMQPSIRAPIANRGPSIMGRGQRQPSTWSWRNPALLHTAPQGPSGPAPRGPSIMNRVPTKRDAEADEEKPRIDPASSPHSVVEQWRQKNLPVTTPELGSEGKVRQQEQGIPCFSSNEKDRVSPDVPYQALPEELSKDISEDEDISDNDVDMDLDDADFQKAQRNHERDLRRLEARRPPAPWNNPEILQMLEELELLATALKESSEGVLGLVPADVGQHSLAIPLDSALAIKQDEEEGVDVKSEQASDEPEVGSSPGTPPLESLPFLHDGSPTPFSDFEELKTPRDEEGDIGSLILTKLQREQDAEAIEIDDARQIFSRIFKPWRRDMDAIDATIREEQERDNSTPPENSFDNTPVPQTVRSRRIVSDYGFEAIIQESKETAAREEQARRLREERDAQIFVPADTFNPEREAIVPNMLGPAEIQDARFLDFNNQVDQHSVLEALRYIPPKDDFTKKEHTDFLYHYVTMPKRFGEISEKLADHRSYKDCVRHYYASKRGTNYRNQEHRFYKTHRGKKFKEATDRAAAGGRPRGGLLASFDGAIDQEAQNAALTESGRPRRAAAPTFGEAPEPETAPAITITPSRRPTIGKDGIGGSPSAEKSTARRGKPATGQKPGRKPKGQPLLAAAPPISPAPSPLKIVNDVVRPITADSVSEVPRVDEREAAQLLATLPTSMQSYAQPSYTEHWVTGQVPYTSASAPPQAQESGFPRRPDQGQQPPPQPKPQQPPETTSYWSVPEKQDFINYVSHFGTNWQLIAQTMKTKTTQMIKNHYTREIDPKKGDKGKDLARAAAIADERIQRNEDMGPIPDPTPVQPKRRYDSHASRDSQRPLAPSIDLTGGGSDSPSLRPTKTQMSPPNLTSTTARFSASSQAEQKAAASSAQVLAQGPQSPANRNVLHMQHPPQRAQNTQGPQMGIFTESRTRPVAQARSLVEGSRREDNEQERLRAQQLQQQQQHTQHQQKQQQQQHQHQKALQDYKENQQQQQRKQQDYQLRQQEIERAELGRALEAREQTAQGQSRRPHLLQDQPHSSSGREPQIIALNEVHIPHVEMNEESRRIFEQRYGHEIPRGRQDEKYHPPDAVHRQTQSNSTSAMQQALAGTLGGIHHRTNPSQSPRTSKMPVPPISRMEPPRPSSVPAANSAPPPQSAQPKKTSNIMSLLNSEPEEPKVSKRHSDPRGGASTPDILTAAHRFQPTSRAPSQHFARPETPSQLPTQQVQNLTIDHQMKQKRQDPPVRSGSVRDMSHGMHRSSIDEILLHQTRPSISQPSFEGPYLSSASSRAGLVPLRDRGPVSPPAPHSRNSSYSSMSQQVPAPHHPEQRPSLSQSAADSRLRPSPYANLTPPQHQSAQQQYAPSQQPQQQQSQLSHTFNALQQRELRQEERRSLDSHEAFQRQQGPRSILLEHRAPSHENMQAMERHYLANQLANQQQDALQQEMRERRRRQEQEQEMMLRHQMEDRRREQVERERGSRGLGFYPAPDARR